MEGWKHNTTAYTELALLDPTHLLYIYDRIPGGHNQPPPAGDSNSVWVVRITVERVPSYGQFCCRPILGADHTSGDDGVYFERFRIPMYTVYTTPIMVSAKDIPKGTMILIK